MFLSIELFVLCHIFYLKNTSSLIESIIAGEKSQKQAEFEDIAKAYNRARCHMIINIIYTGILLPMGITATPLLYECRFLNTWAATRVGIPIHGTAPTGCYFIISFTLARTSDMLVRSTGSITLLLLLAIPLSCSI